MQRGNDLNLDEWLAAFATAPGVGIALLSADLRILYANAAAARLFSSLAPEELNQRRLDELFPSPWVEQRAAVIERVLASKRPAIIRSIMRGRQIETTLHAVAADSEQPDRVLMVSVEGETPEQFLPEDVEVVESDTVDLGPLAVLTPRELEVLALIGQGHSAKEIASILQCSPRTVERHRDSIGKKLDKDDRVKLAIVARAAGLELRDAQLNRISVDDNTREDAMRELKPAHLQRAAAEGQTGTSPGCADDNGGMPGGAQRNSA